MFTDKLIELYKNYVFAHNSNNEEQADKTYSIFFSELEYNFGEDDVDNISNILCTTKNKKITYEKNLMELGKYLN